MRKSVAVFFGCVTLALIAAPLHAQTGCTDSPENPSIVLAVLGGAGALYSSWRARKGRRGPRCE